MVTISKALPVKFWLSGDDSYNTKVVDGMDSVCFFKPIQCDDPVKLQITEQMDDTETTKEYKLSILENDSEIVSLDFVRTSVITKASLDPAYPFANYGAGSISWTLGPPIHIDINNSTSKYLRAGVIDGIANKTIRFKLVVNATHTGGTGFAVSIINCKVTVYNDDMSLSSSETLQLFNAGTTTLNYSITPAFIPKWVTLQFVAIPLGGAPTVHADVSLDVDPDSFYISDSTFDLVFTPSDLSLCQKYLSFQILNSGTDEMVAYSDVHRILTIVKKSNLISYKSFTDFAGLRYSDDSDYFNIRIPSVFFRETYQVTNKSLNLSNSRTITTAMSKKVQRLLSISDMPDYMHETLAEIFMHSVSGSLLIDGNEWVIENDFEDDGSRPPTYPMRPSKILLTKKAGFIQNII